MVETVKDTRNHPLKSSVSDNVKSADVSARKKALLLGRMLGLASEDDYRPSSASIAERSAYRAQKLSSQYQSNLETIYKIAISQTPSDVTGVDLDPDWAHQFFQLAEQIHNRKMQELWGRILASEITIPGNFSLRTLATLKQLTHKEAQVLEKALGMSVLVNNESKLKLVIGFKHASGLGHFFKKSTQTNIGLSQFGLPYSNILTLIEAGILHRSELETGLLSSKKPINFALSNIKLKLTPKTGQLFFNYYRFTPVGDELAQLIQFKTDTNYIKALKAVFAQDFRIEE
ncbi:TIGR03899 family protein [Shewanella gelidimarina]|uniref:TIGR03899 family protein n=1 Tax=Shewanella gelidimarina TaxID=56813 RepID=UPI002010B471|nr:TIGR03899 family protein [Shewanella gelidimarina]MCL1058499.1 TIGR03899 family protein [Shewanella gelidimarina]